SGFMIVDGELEELQKIQLEDENLKLMAEASSIVEGFEVTMCAGGSDQAVGESVTRYVETLASLGYM
ncbi:MAG: hypothetical protein M3271_02820, partial [Actinomycetota bacterium]|nr:hypothetical protein [Actinomycetota bacterium]